ncbi:hypothetical protein [Pseudomonas sp. SK3(2021)]|uniref:hypothetical protein n=1 Tax=Pseudomonas sp. SK3(2021) TaxID=2841064 RepID=UPI0020784BE0|nr:hypothetical protein [Pseudomonas sp. SK3(2021)]
MKTFSSVVHLLCRAPLRRRGLSRQAPLPVPVSQPLVRLLCVERKGARVGCMPGAPIVRLPH